MGKKVVIVSKSSEIGSDIIEMDRGHVLKRLSDSGGEWLTNTDIEEIKDSGVIVEGKDGKKRPIKADTLVIATGLVPSKELYEALNGKVPELHNVGDSCEARMIVNAIHEGFFAGFT